MIKSFLETRVYTTSDQIAHKAVKKLSKLAWWSYFNGNLFITYGNKGYKEYTYEELISEFSSSNKIN